MVTVLGIGLFSSVMLGGTAHADTTSDTQQEVFLLTQGKTTDVKEAIDYLNTHGQYEAALKLANAHPEAAQKTEGTTETAATDLQKEVFLLTQGKTTDVKEAIDYLNAHGQYEAALKLANAHPEAAQKLAAE